jgi:transposase
MVALKRIQGLVKSIMGVVISEASFLKYVLNLHAVLEGWEQRMIEQVVNLPSLHVNETSFRIDKRNHWIHVYASGDITLKCLH